MKWKNVTEVSKCEGCSKRDEIFINNFYMRHVADLLVYITCNTRSLRDGKKCLKLAISYTRGGPCNCNCWQLNSKRVMRITRSHISYPVQKAQDIREVLQDPDYCR